MVQGGIGALGGSYSFTLVYEKVSVAAVNDVAIFHFVLLASGSLMHIFYFI